MNSRNESRFILTTQRDEDNQKKVQETKSWETQTRTPGDETKSLKFKKLDNSSEKQPFRKERLIQNFNRSTSGAQGQLKDDQIYLLLRPAALEYGVNRNLKLGQLIKNLVENMQQLCQYKNARFLSSQLQNLAGYNKKLEHLVYFPDNDQIYRDMNFEFLFKRLVLSSVKIHQNTKEYLFRPDKFLLEYIKDLDDKLEEKFIKIQEENFKNLRIDFKRREIDIKNKIMSVEEALLQNNKKQQFIIFKKTQNYIMHPSNRKSIDFNFLLSRTEEKLNEFTFIKKKTRSYARNIGDLVSYLDDNKK